MMQMIINNIILRKMVKTEKWTILIDLTKPDIQKLLYPGREILLHNERLL